MPGTGVAPEIMMGVPSINVPYTDLTPRDHGVLQALEGALQKASASPCNCGRFDCSPSPFGLSGAYSPWSHLGKEPTKELKTEQMIKYGIMKILAGRASRSCLGSILTSWAQLTAQCKQSRRIAAVVSRSTSRLTSKCMLTAWRTAGILARQGEARAQQMRSGAQTAMLRSVIGSWSRSAAGMARALAAAELKLERSTSEPAGPADSNDVSQLGMPATLGDSKRTSEYQVLEGLLHQHNEKMRSMQEKMDAVRWRSRPNDKHMQRMSRLRQVKQDLSARKVLLSSSMKRSSSEPPSPKAVSSEWPTPSSSTESLDSAPSPMPRTESLDSEPVLSMPALSRTQSQQPKPAPLPQSQLRPSMPAMSRVCSQEVVPQSASQKPTEPLTSRTSQAVRVQAEPSALGRATSPWGSRPCVQSQSQMTMSTPRPREAPRTPVQSPRALPTLQPQAPMTTSTTRLWETPRSLLQSQSQLCCAHENIVPVKVVAYGQF